MLYRNHWNLFALGKEKQRESAMKGKTEPKALLTVQAYAEMLFSTPHFLLKTLLICYYVMLS